MSSNISGVTGLSLHSPYSGSKFLQKRSVTPKVLITYQERLFKLILSISLTFQKFQMFENEKKLSRNHAFCCFTLCLTVLNATDEKSETRFVSKSFGNH